MHAFDSYSVSRAIILKFGSLCDCHSIIVMKDYGFIRALFDGNPKSKIVTNKLNHIGHMAIITTQSDLVYFA